MRAVRYYLCFIMITALGLGSTAAVADTLLVPDHPQQYIVRKGDTLWDIAAKFLTKPWRWPELWDINSHIENPHLIYPGDLLRIVTEGGQQYIELVRGGGVGVDGASGDSGSGAPLSASGSREVKLSPKIKEFSRDSDSIPLISLEKVYPFIRHVRVVGADEYISWPYVLTTVKDGRFSQTLSDNTSTIYVRGDLDPKIRSFSIYHPNKSLYSPKNPDVVVGHELIYVGVFVVTEFGGDNTYRGRLVNNELPLQAGDRLYPDGTIDNYALSFVPQLAPNGLSGTIISVLDGNIAVSENNVVAIDLGEQNGIRPGMILSLYNRAVEFGDTTGANLSARQAAGIPLKFANEDTNYTTGLFSKSFNALRDFKNDIDRTPFVEYLGAPQQAPENISLWPELNGKMIVFRTFDTVSYGLVVELNRPAFSDDVLLSADMVLSEAN